jgi:hypothetical protein
VLYELLTGSLPFSIEGDPMEVLERRVQEDPVPITEVAPQVPDALAAVTMRALQRDPDDRYPSAEAFGVAVGEAATESFGPGWLGRSDLTLVAAGPIAISAGPATTTTDTASGGATVSDASAKTGRETMIAGKGTPIPQELPLRVRATAVHRATGARIGDLSPEDLVRVDDLIRPPRAPRFTLAAAGLLLAALLAISALGLGSPQTSGSLKRGQVAVAGVDAASGRTVGADLAHGVPVRVYHLPGPARQAHYVRLGFSAFGVELPASRSAVLVPSRHGGFQASVDATRDRILFAGRVTGTVRFLDSNKHGLLASDFRFDAQRPFYVVANGVLGLLVLAFALSYAWSLSHPLRRGRRRSSAFVGMGINGAITGAMIVDLGWAIVGPQPTLATVVAGIILGMLAFVLLAQGILVLGRRRRLVTARARSEAPADR